MTVQLSCFKAYDIRGKLGSEINNELAYKLGLAFSQYLQPKTVVIGGDARLTSEELKNHIVQGLLDSGVDVIDLGLIGTEEIYFATSFLAADGGIMVTASHNPIDYNGMKLVGKNSVSIGSDSGLNEIKQIISANNFPSPAITKGVYKQLSVLDQYVDKLLSFINLDNFKRPLKLVINSGNGAAGHVIDALEIRFRQLNLPITLVKVHNQPDGTFPNGIPNPLLVENRQDTIDAVLNHQADLGIAFDGDFDRCFLFDENGLFIEGYYIVGLLAKAFLVKNKAEKIIYDPRMIWNTIELVNENGGEPVICMSGHSFIKSKMRAVDAIYAGEMSAHNYFRDFFYCDSGMLTWLLVAELISSGEQSLSQMVQDRMQRYPASGEINSRVADPQAIINTIKIRFTQEAIDIHELDGLSMEFADWRFNLRVGNTEPILRLNIETRANQELLDTKITELLEIIRA